MFPDLPPDLDIHDDDGQDHQEHSDDPRGREFLTEHGRSYYGCGDEFHHRYEGGLGDLQSLDAPCRAIEREQRKDESQDKYVQEHLRICEGPEDHGIIRQRQTEQGREQEDVEHRRHGRILPVRPYLASEGEHSEEKSRHACASYPDEVQIVMFPGHDPGDQYASDERHDDRYHLLYRYAFFEKEQGEDHDVVRRGHLQECRKGQVDKHLGLEQGDVRHELERSEQGEQQHALGLALSSDLSTTSIMTKSATAVTRCLTMVMSMAENPLSPRKRTGMPRNPNDAAPMATTSAAPEFKFGVFDNRHTP